MIFLKTEKEKKKEKNKIYTENKAPGNGKVSPCSPRGNVSFPLRMPPVGRKRKTVKTENIYNEAVGKEGRIK